MEIVLETPRLILCRFTAADASLVYQLNNDPEVLKYIHEPATKSVEHAREVIVNIILPQYENKLGRWAIYTKNNNNFVGWCGLKYLKELDETDLGYRFLPAEWGRGYATEAAGYVLSYGFKHLNLKEIIGKAHVENIASIKVLQKIGMRFVKQGIEADCPVKIFSALNPQFKKTDT